MVWEVKKLGDVLEVLKNGINCKQNKKGQGEKITRIETIAYAKIDTDKVGFSLLNESDKLKYRIKKGDILFSHINSPPHVGKTALFKSDEELYHGVNLLLMRPKNFMLSVYLEYFLKYLYQCNYWKKECKQSVNQASVNQQDINKVLIKYPNSLSEQKRIVAILDKAFENMSIAKENDEKNLKNAKEVFESYLQSVFENKGEGWEEKTLGAVCLVERGSSPRPIQKFITKKDNGVNWIKIGDTKNVEKYIYSTEQKITPEGATKSRFVDVGDFILSNSMSFGKPYIIKTQGYIHDGWFVLRLPENIDTEFFWYLLSSSYTMNQFIHLASGAIVKNISGDLVKKTILPIPPLKQQKLIAKQFDIISTETNKLSLIYEKKLASLEELKKSILQKAFKGELLKG